MYLLTSPCLYSSDICFGCKIQVPTPPFISFFFKSSPACIRVVVQIRSYLTRHILAKHMAKILWIPCCLFCSHSIIFWVKKLPLDPPLTVRCYCQTAPKLCSSSSMIFSSHQNSHVTRGCLEKGLHKSSKNHFQFYSTFSEFLYSFPRAQLESNWFPSIDIHRNFW